MLRQLPRTSELVFSIGVDGLRKAWLRICQKTGLTGEHELRIHDLRHEAISRVAEAGSNTPGGFSLIDLQRFSGRRDIRMLLRYAHLYTQSLAKHLDAVFGSPSESVSHHGRRRLKSSASVSLKRILDESAQASPAAFANDVDLTIDNVNMANPQASASKNVIHVNFARKLA